MGVIKVLVADNLAMVRGALAVLLGQEPDIEVVAQAGTGAAAIDAARSVLPDVAVLDAYLRDHDGAALAALLRSAVPGCRSILLVGHANATRIGEAMLGAAAGLLAKDAPPGRLTDAVRQVHRGERVIDAGLVVDAFRRGHNPLTKRERDLLEYLAKGADVRDIAAELFLVPGTVRNYLSAIMTKIGARNRMDAVRIARERGWLVEGRPR